jgi:DNA repair photolyase
MACIDEIDVSNPLSVSQLHKKGLCDYVINPAVGCLHGCKFCYVPSTPAVRTRFAQLQSLGVEDPQMEWGKYLFVRKDVATKLDAVLTKKRTWKATAGGKGVILLCSGTDPYQNTKVARITREVVQVCLKHGKRVRILTRSPLFMRDADILTNPLVTVGMSIPHTDDRAARLIESHAPAPSRRLDAIAQASAGGCRTFVAMAPTLPTAGLEGFKDHLDALMTTDPELIFWEPINARGKNFSLMQQAGIPWINMIRAEKDAAAVALRQWDQMEKAADSLGISRQLHYWPDKSWVKHTSDISRFEQWWERPTIERWEAA